MRQEASRFLCLTDAHLKVGIMCTIGPRRFTGLLTDFNRRHKGIQLQLIEGVPSKLSELLEAGEIDVAIMSTSESFPERFDVTPLFRERFMLAFPAGHRLAEYDAVPIAAIDGEIYLRRANCEYWDHLSDLCDAHGVNMLDLLFERARGLDPEHGRRRPRHLLHPRNTAPSSRACRSGRSPSRKCRAKSVWSPSPAAASRRRS